ncbi:MAG: cytochrome c-type biogenesis protein CcmH/NrfG [Saprospiraceae bacterium]|jgi:cytochrome c-type biogenesis protein CcmH/NrfG
MTMIGGFFKKLRYQRFEYKPRYWDPEKEELEGRVKVAQGTGDNDPEAVKRRIANNLRRNYKSRSNAARTSSKKSTIMLFVIIGALVVLSYYFLTVYLPVIEKSLGN